MFKFFERNRKEVPTKELVEEAEKDNARINALKETNDRAKKMMPMVPGDAKEFLANEIRGNEVEINTLKTTPLTSSDTQLIRDAVEKNSK